MVKEDKANNPRPAAGSLLIDPGMGLSGDMFCAALIASGAPERGVLDAMRFAQGLLGGGFLELTRGSLPDGVPARRLTLRTEAQAPLPITEAPALLERAVRASGVRGGYAGFAQRALTILCQAERVAHRLDGNPSGLGAVASLRVVGTAHTPYREHAPYQAPEETAEGSFWIDLHPSYAEALRGLDSFSHLFVLSHLERSPGWGTLVRPPWRTDERVVGLFATRSPNRPSPIGLTRARVLSVAGTRVQTGPMDLFDGTPVLDIKPYIQSLDGPPSGAVTGPGAPNDGWLAGSDHLELHLRGVPHEHPGGGQLHEAQNILLQLSGAAWALQWLGADLGSVRCISPVRVGGGSTLPSSHGRLSVPAPATLAILEEYEIPFEAGPVPAELMTPTGAAILAALSPTWVETSEADASGLVTAAGLGNRSFGSQRPNAVVLHWRFDRRAP